MFKINKNLIEKLFYKNLIYTIFLIFSSSNFFSSKHQSIQFLKICLEKSGKKLHFKAGSYMRHSFLHFKSIKLKNSKGHFLFVFLINPAICEA